MRAMRVEQFGHVVVRLDLRRVRIELEAEPVRRHLAAQRLPVDLRIGDQVRVVVADRTVDLAQERQRLRASRRCRRCARPRWRFPCPASWAWPAGRACARASAPRRSPAPCRAARRRCRRSPAAAPALCASASISAVRQVVDVLRRAGKVEELRHPGHFGKLREALLQPVFDRLDVVVGRALDGLDARGIFRRERRRRRVERRLRRGRERYAPPGCRARRRAPAARRSPREPGRASGRTR